MIRKISFCGLMLGMAMAMNFAACDDSDNETYEGNQQPVPPVEEHKIKSGDVCDTASFKTVCGEELGSVCFCENCTCSYVPVTVLSCSDSKKVVETRCDATADNRLCATVNDVVGCYEGCTSKGKTKEACIDENGDRYYTTQTCTLLNGNYMVWLDGEKKRCDANGPECCKKTDYQKGDECVPDRFIDYCDSNNRHVICKENKPGFAKGTVDFFNCSNKDSGGYKYRCATIEKATDCYMECENIDMIQDVCETDNPKLFNRYKCVMSSDGYTVWTVIGSGLSCDNSKANCCPKD